VADHAANAFIAFDTVDDEPPGELALKLAVTWRP
jgi:hypothetical protein